MDLGLEVTIMEVEARHVEVQDLHLDKVEYNLLELLAQPMKWLKMVMVDLKGVDQGVTIQGIDPINHLVVD